MITGYESRPSGLIVPKHQPTQEELRLKAEQLRKAYYAAHAVCPQCKGPHLEETCMGYIVGWGKPEDDYDGNRCTCNCGWVGKRHDMVPAEAGE